MAKYNGTEVAIIGMACQFPRASDIQQFWTNIIEGKECISFFTDDELLSEGNSEEAINHPLYVKANAFLDDKQFFDADFFGYIPAEAKLMDPQLRIFHEVCWKALEDAGYGQRSADEKVGLFAGGTSNNNWQNFAILSNSDSTVDPFTASQLRDVTYLCSRIAFALDLRGPAVFVNTACSTSLVAIQKAYMSLLLRECTMALAGGIRINNYSKRGYRYEEGMITSPDGHCRTFDAQAAGTVGGEGAGIVVLKRLSEAIADRDNIYAIIRGAAINNDGRQKMSFTAPSVDGQHKVILKALNMAKINPHTISYIEAHGTATKLGDPVEVEALTLAFGNSKGKYCALGSVKSNIGHLDTAAGVAGFIKATLAIKHRLLPPSPNFKEPNPKINFEHSPFYVNDTLKDWHSEHPLRAGVTSLGIGGTNAHLILEEAPVIESSNDNHQEKLLVISGRTQSALQRNLVNLRLFLEQNSEVNLRDVAYTLMIGRMHMQHRHSVVCRNIHEAITELAESGQTDSDVLEPIESPAIVFMFPGQGSQYSTMFAGLYEHDLIFRQTIDQCFSFVSQKFNKDLKSVLFPSKHEPDGSINYTEFAQPILFMIEYALARVLMNIGIQPTLMIGHSIGEYVAACLSGVFSWQDALTVTVKRGELMGRMETGAMVSIIIGEDELSSILNTHPKISLAAVNGTRLCVAAGAFEAVTDLETLLAARDIRFKRIRTSHAFHSHMMEPALSDFANVIASVVRHKPQTPFVSNVPGKFISSEQAQSVEYWVEHLRKTVRFADGIRTCFSRKNVVAIEVGPGGSLSTMAHSNVPPGHRMVSIPMGKQSTDPIADPRHFLNQLGKIWSLGQNIQWEKLYAEEDRRRISLPSYAFERTEFPVVVDAYKMISEMVSGNSKFRKDKASDWFHEPVWTLASRTPDTVPCDQSNLNILFINNDQIGDDIARAFSAAGENNFMVRRGNSSERNSDKTFVISSANDEGLLPLFNAIPDADRYRIIFCWAIDSLANASLSISSGVKSVAEFLRLTDIAKYIHGKNPTAEVELLCVCNNLSKVLSPDQIDPSKSILIGALKVIAKEYPSIRTRCIDINTGDIDMLMAELNHRVNGRFELVAYRSKTRFVQTIQPIYRVEKDVSKGKLRSNAVYLITGGSGGMAQTFVKSISQRYESVTFVLLSRRPLTEEPQPIIAQNGCRIYRFQCDVSEVDELRETISAIENIAGPICGIIQAAGVADFGGIIHNRKHNSYDDVFKAKVYGTINLHNVFSQRKLDFFVLCSSISSLTSPAGECGYVAANTFLDYYAQYACDTTSLNPVSIGWNRWLQVGMAVSTSMRDGVTYDSINPKSGYELLELALQLGKPHLILSKYNLTLLLDEQQGQQPSYVADAVQQDIGRAEYQKPSKEILLTMWSKYFGKTVESSDDFFHIGGDSLKALTIIERIHKTLNVAVPISDFFAYPTIDALSEYIDRVRASTTTLVQFSSIQPASQKEYYPISSAQKRLYLLYQFDNTSLAYNIAHGLTIKGKLDKTRLESAFRQLVQRHEILRTCFELHPEAGLVQRVIDDRVFEIEWKEAEGLNEKDIVRNFIRPFDLAKAPLIRVGVYRHSDQRHTMVVDIHHIVSDGISLGILIEEFVDVFNGKVLPQPHLQYIDYAEWQLDRGRKEVLEKQKEFWLAAFSSGVPVLHLPTDYKRPLLKSFDGAVVPFDIDSERTQKLKAIADRHGCTMYMLILAIYNVFLNKLTGQTDIVVGTVTSGRQHADVERMIGMFVNTIALRNYPKADIPFAEFLKAVKFKTLQSFDNQSQPYEELLDSLKIERDMSRNPLFDVVFAYQTFEHPQLKIPDLEIQSVNADQVVSKFDLTLSGIEDVNNDKLILSFEYCTQLFHRSTIDRFCRYFKTIVNDIISDEGRSIADIEFVPDSEKQVIMNTFGQGPVVSHERSLINMVTFHAKKTPEKTAICVAHQSNLSFEELHIRSNRLAHYLIQKHHAAPADVIGLLCTDPINMIVGVLACGKIGCAYALFSSGDLNDAVESPGACTMIFTDDEYFGSASIVRLVELNNEFAAIAEQASVDLPHPSELNLVACIEVRDHDDYKVISRNDLLNQCLWMANKVALTERESILFLSSPTSWCAQRDLLASLASGSTLIIIDDHRYSPALITDVITKHEVTILDVTMPVLHLLLHHAETTSYSPLSSLRHVVLNTNSYSAPLRRWILSSACNAVFHNVFSIDGSPGVVSCRKLSNPADALLYSSSGNPVDNTAIFIADAAQKSVALGVCGEIYISNGYSADPNRKVRTGRFGKWLANGELYVHSRNAPLSDDIEKDIEDVLLRDPSIIHVHVTNSDQEPDAGLIVYYSAPTKLNSEELALKLSERLPAHLVPRYFIHVKEMPLNNAGEVNIRLLPDPVFKKISFEAPELPTEIAIAKLWQQVLGVDRVGLHDNFFALGGNSLSTMKLLTAIKKEWNIDLPIRVLFKANTVRLFAQALEQHDTEIVPIEEDDFEELTL